MQRSLLSAIAQLPEDEQDEAIDSLVDAIIAEGLRPPLQERLATASPRAQDPAQDELGPPGLVPVSTMTPR